MRIWVALFAGKIQNQNLQETQPRPRVSWLGDSFDSAKEDAIGAIKTIGRTREPMDEVGGRLCHIRDLLNFPAIFKKKKNRNHMSR